MKLHLPVRLLTCLLALFSPMAAMAGEPASYTLGNVMYVGDSITHGVASGSYRWAMHKIFVDNGLSYTEEGIKTGNYSGGVASGTRYGGTAFMNKHSSEASARAWELSGNASYDASSSWKHSGGTRYDGSNILNWLGQSTTNNKGATYTGTTFTGAQTPDQFFLMIGTNDLLSDTNKGASLVANKTQIISHILTDINATYNSMMTANSEAKVVLSLIPAFCQTGAASETAAVHTAVQEFNTALTEWAKDKRGVTVVDVNKGISDVTSAKVLDAVPATMNPSDKLHPTAQGDLIIAGNMAKAMGYGGRTAGKERVAGSEFATIAAGSLTTTEQYTAAGFTATNVTTTDGLLDFSAAGTSTLSYDWGIDAATDKGFTVDFNLALGNGATDGWNTSDQFSVVIGNGEFSGVLNINEAYIKWGDSILYSDNISANTDNLRISYIYGSGTDNLNSGYYVWLDDMLIGEGLGYTADSAHNGVTFSYSGTGTALLSQVGLDSTAAYAPTTTGLYNEASHYEAPVRGEVATGPGTLKDWGADVSQTATLTPTTSGKQYLREASSATAGDIAIKATLASGSSEVYASSGDYTGDVWVNITSGSASSWYAAHGGSGTLTGNAYLKLSDTVGTGSTVFGAVNATEVTGNVYVEISAESATFNSFTSTAGQQSSLVGSYKTNIGGSMTFVLNAGTYSTDIRGGIHTGSGNTIGGGTNIFFNGGTAQGAIYGGGREGTISNGTAVSINGGSVTGKVYGGGSSGTINGGTGVTLNGGSLNSDVFGGGSGGTINGGTSVSVLGGSYGHRIYGGGEGGTINGTATVLVGGDSTVVTDHIAGGGTGGTVENTLVQITGGTVGWVFGGGLGSKITGDTAIRMSGGQATHLFGGSMSSSAGDTIGGNTSIEMTGGKVTGKVAGACATRNSSLVGNSSVRILGGSVGGDVFGGSNAGSVGGSTYVELGVADKQTGLFTEIGGSVYGGNENNYAIGKDSTVAITDVDVVVKGNTISAGSKSGAIKGDTELRLSNIKGSESRRTDDISHYKGTFSGGTNVSGTRTLAFSNVQNDFSAATIANFDRIEVSEGSDVKLSGTGGAGSIQVAAGSSLALMNITSGANVEIENLHLLEGAVMGFYTSATLSTEEASILITGSLSAGDTSVLNANLVLGQSATLDFTGTNGLQMGSTVTLQSGSQITLSETLRDTLSGMVRGEELVLFRGVDEFIIGGAEYDETERYAAVDFFDLGAHPYAEHFVVSYDAGADGGRVSLYMATPEPSAATLSLLALAALAARRKRK